MKIYKNIQNSFEQQRTTVIHGNIMILQWLLKYSSRDIFIGHLVEISQYILQYRNHNHPKNREIKQSVIESIPILAKYNPGVFSQEHLDQTFHFLIKQIEEQNGYQSKCFYTLAEIFSLIDKTLLKRQYVKKLIEVILKELRNLQTPFQNEVIHCLDSLFRTFKSRMQSRIHLNKLIDYILLNGLHKTSIDFLKTFTMFNNESLMNQISIKILMAISLSLQRGFFQFPLADTGVDK
jgi:hypothetical protein